MVGWGRSLRVELQVWTARRQVRKAQERLIELQVWAGRLRGRAGAVPPVRAADVGRPPIESRRGGPSRSSRAAGVDARAASAQS
jgi:hypothetical protein